MLSVVHLYLVTKMWIQRLLFLALMPFSSTLAQDDGAVFAKRTYFYVGGIEPLSNPTNYQS